MILKSNKKKFFLAAVIILAIAAVLIIARGDEDTWLCQNGQWIRHGNPNAQMPTTGCGQAGATKTDSLNINYPQGLFTQLKSTVYM